jgi:hypothetical protein
MQVWLVVWLQEGRSRSRGARQAPATTAGSQATGPTSETTSRLHLSFRLHRSAQVLLRRRNLILHLSVKFVWPLCHGV